MFDLRELEVPPERGDWSAAPDAVRAACALLISLGAFAALRAWMVIGQWHEFLRSYGRSRHLDMTTEAGWTMARLHTPDQFGAIVDLGLVGLLSLLVLGVLHRASATRVSALVVSAVLALDAVASVAYPVPWWYVVASAALAVGAVVMAVLLLRPRTSMHLRPEPLTLREELPAPNRVHPPSAP